MNKKDYQKLAEEWDYERNDKNEIYFDDVTSGSGKKVWWKCKNGHEWEAKIASRKNGQGCPFCSGHRAFPGFNDLATKNPALASEWNYEKNGDLRPQDVTVSSGKKVWWRCKEGHEWEASAHTRSKGSGCPFCSGQRVFQGFNDLATKNPQLSAEWNYKRNGSLVPQIFTINSEKKVWWKCKNGHEWEARIVDRNRSGGCPICSSHRILPGFNDLATKNPILASEWNYEKNGDLRPQDVTVSSGKKVWWKCKNGHEWEAQIAARNGGNGCPICSGRGVLTGINDLATINPELADEWNYKRNGSLKPQDITSGSKRRVWWKCKNGHEWEATVSSRNNGNGCPVCSGKKVLPGVNDLATTNPQLADEWNYEKNGDLKPQDFAPNSNKKVWWKCKNGHEWEAKILYRNRGGGCPVCSNKKVLPGINDLATTNPQLADEWNYEKNGDLKPQDVIAGSGKMVWWKCKNGHEWEAQINSRNTGVGCPTCSQSLHISFPEKAIFFYMRQAFPDAIENYKPEWLGKMELDIFIPSIKVGIEYDGARYHKNKSSDAKKDKVCKEQGITLIRIREKGLDCEATQSLAFTLSEDYKIGGEHLVPGLKFLEKQLGVDLDINMPRDYDRIRSMVVNYDLDNCIAKTNPESLAEWDYEKNGQAGITPENISAGSGIVVWWKCRNGHSHRAAPVHKIGSHYGCPYCSNKIVLPGFNDLATTNPQLADEWNYEKNGDLKPQDITRGSSKKVWWKCKNEHEWEATVSNRNRGSGCPYCAGKKRLNH